MDDGGAVSVDYNSRDELENTRVERLKRRRKIRLYILAAVCILIAFFAIYQFTDIIYGVPSELTSASQGDDWAMFGHDLYRTGSTGPSGKIPEGTLKWSFATGGIIYSSPAVWNETVYFGSIDYNIYAVDASTGEERWRYRTGSWVRSSPIIVDGILYIGSNDSKLYALDAVTGEKLWEFEATYAVRSSPAVANGTLYFGGDDFHLYAIDMETGQEKWRLKTGNMLSSSPVVFGGIVYIGSHDGYIYAVNANNGKLRLKFNTRSMVVASPVVVDGIVYSINTQGRIYAVDGGAKNWPIEEKILHYWNALYIYGVAPKPPAPSGYLWTEWLMGYSSADLAYSDGVLYTGVGSRVIALDTEEQSQLWELMTGDRITASPATEEGVLYVGSGDGYLYAIDAASGAEIWKAKTGGEISSSPAIVDGVVYIGSHDGRLYAFE